MKDSTMTDYIWRSTGDAGFEHVRVDDSHPGWTVYDSMIVRAHDGNVRRGGYTLIVDKAWRALELRVMAETEPGSMIAQHLLADGNGAWTDSDERAIPSLAGCMDVDIAWTPLTNTLPVRRLDLRQGEPRDIDVVYLSMPDLAISRMRQRYTRLDAHRVRYESLASGFSREITLDDDGFVESYPDLFQREWPDPLAG
jgi:hypothetical protein